MDKKFAKLEGADLSIISDAEKKICNESGEKVALVAYCVE